jgi:hypothetical protein
MLNNLTNFFNLIKARMIKTTLENADLIATGTRDTSYGGSYKPTAITYSDLRNQIAASLPPSGVTAVTGTSPVVSSGGATPTISMPAATTSVSGHLRSTDWNTFNGKQDALVSGTNIKTVNSNSLLGSGDIAVQPTLVSGTSIKTINSTSLLGSGDVAVQPTLVSGTSIKTVNSTSLLGSGDVPVQPTLVSGTNIKTVNGNSLLGSGNVVIASGRQRQSLAAATGIAQYSAGSGSTFGAAWFTSNVLQNTGQIIDVDFMVRNPSGNNVQMALYVNNSSTLTGALQVGVFTNPQFDWIQRYNHRFIICQDGTNIRLMGPQYIASDFGVNGAMINTTGPLIGNTTTGVTLTVMIWAISFNGSLIAASVDY